MNAFKNFMKQLPFGTTSSMNSELLFLSSSVIKDVFDMSKSINLIHETIMKDE